VIDKRDGRSGPPRATRYAVAPVARLRHNRHLGGAMSASITGGLSTAVAATRSVPFAWLLWVLVAVTLCIDFPFLVASSPDFVWADGLGSWCCSRTPR
jgi:hypothetical protein